MLTTNTVPPIVLDYLKEGNSKEDLIEWIWGLIPQEEMDEILKEANNQYNEQEQ